MKRYHDQGNSYKTKHSIEAGLQFQRFSPLSSWWEAWASCRQTWCWRSQEFYILIQRQIEEDSLLQAARRRVFPHWVELEHSTSKSTPTMTYFLQQGHTSSNKATSPNSVILYGQTFKPPHTIWWPHWEQFARCPLFSLIA